MEWSGSRTGFYCLPSPETFNSSAAKECSGHPGGTGSSHELIDYILLFYFIVLLALSIICVPVVLY